MGDRRASGSFSRRRPLLLSPEEAEDFSDLIEWAGIQPWSNGRVGLTGVSYLTVAQWRVAGLTPPHLWLLHADHVDASQPAALL